jgi:adenylate cyclase
MADSSYTPRGGQPFIVAVDDEEASRAARLEGKAPVGGVALGPGTVERLPGARTEPLGEIAVKGKADSVTVHRLVSVDGERR